MHELAVAQSVRAGGCSDPHDPKRSEVTLLDLSARKSEVKRSLDLLLCMSIQLALGAPITAGEFQYVLAFLKPFVSTFGTRHKSSILIAALLYNRFTGRKLSVRISLPRLSVSDLRSARHG